MLTSSVLLDFGLGRLADPKLKHNFQDCVNPICSCGQESETSTHFLLHCSNYHCARQTLFKKVNKIDLTILKQNDQVTTKLLLFGNKKIKLLKTNLYSNQNKSTSLQLSSYRLSRDLKPHNLIKYLTE